MGRKKRRRRADRERASERDQDDEAEREAASAGGTPMGMPDAPIPDSPMPDAPIPDAGVPDMGVGGAGMPGAAMGQEDGRGATPSLTMRGYSPEAQQHIHRATEETGTDPHDVPDPVLDVLATGGGQSLDAPIQRALEDRMDADFSDVEIHTGPAAAKAADAIDARAFTCGNAIVFNDGEYDPESAEGQHLLAHELAHVKQQTGAAISMMPQADAELEIDPDPQLEREADQAAEEALSGEEPLIVNRLGTDVHIQRLPDEQSSLKRFTDSEDQVPPHPVRNSDAALGSATRKDYKKTFFEVYPWLEGNVVVHHAIEQRVLKRYPEVVTESEMHSLENLRGIPKELNSEIHLGEIRKEWNKFYKSHPDPDKQDLLAKATEIDDKYGHLFKPPVRD